MSASSAIAAVTTTLRNLLDGEPALDGATITTRPPDKARPDNDDENRVNVFCYRTSINAGLANMELAGTVGPHERGHPPLSLDLHYVFTAYGMGNDETLSNQLLGTAMQILHERPELRRSDLENALADSELHLQPERVRITYEPLTLDDISKLWTTFQTEYRFSTFYEASVVLIESRDPTIAPLPVLRRGPEDEGVRAHATPAPPFPTLVAAIAPKRQPAALVGDILQLEGHHLGGDSVSVSFTHTLLGVPIVSPADAGSTDTRISVTIPNSPTILLTGILQVSATISKAASQDYTTNSIPVAVAPRLVGVSPPNPVPAGSVILTVSAEPEVRLQQRAALLFGNREVRPEPRAAQADPLVFDLGTVDSGEYFVRLRIDGVDSLLIDYTTDPPQFDVSQKVIVQ